MSANHGLDILYAECPQLKEKAIVDFINGMEVNGDLIRVREEVNSGFISRIWQDITGDSHTRQQQIDKNMEAGLHAVSDWLQVLQSNQVKSDLAITTVSQKLIETRQGLMRLQAHHKDLKVQVDGLMIYVEQLDGKFSDLKNKLYQVDAGRLATQQMDAVYDKWQVGKLDEYPLLVRLYLVLDEMYWGDFGTYCRQYKVNTDEIERLIEQVKNKAIIQMKEDMKSMNMETERVFTWQQEIGSSLQKLNADRKQALTFLTNYGEQEKIPMPWIFHRYLTVESGEELVVDSLPYILDANNAVEHMIQSFRRRYEYEQR
jgi:hypothetical protein